MVDISLLFIFCVGGMASYAFVALSFILYRSSAKETDKRFTKMWGIKRNLRGKRGRDGKRYKGHSGSVPYLSSFLPRSFISSFECLYVTFLGYLVERKLALPLFRINIQSPSSPRIPMFGGVVFLICGRRKNCIATALPKT